MSALLEVRHQFVRAAADGTGNPGNFARYFVFGDNHAFFARNRVNHTQIAEARISYGGRGQISAVQRPNWGQRIADAVSPW